MNEKNIILPLIIIFVVFLSIYTFTGNILPWSNNSTLGNSTRTWLAVYAENIYMNGSEISKVCNGYYINELDNGTYIYINYTNISSGVIECGN